MAAGFEHSIANLFFLPLGWLVSTDAEAPSSLANWTVHLRRQQLHK